jgi:hypothetical protein
MTPPKHKDPWLTPDSIADLRAQIAIGGEELVRQWSPDYAIAIARVRST